MSARLDDAQAIPADTFRARPAWYVLTRLRFSALLLGTLLLVAALTGSLTHSVAGSGLLGRVGYGLVDLRAGRLDRLATSVLFALHPWMLATIATIILIGVVPYELAAGTRRAALVFSVSQVGSYLLASLLVAWPLDALGTSWGHALAQARDVGASAGAFGCAGALAWHLTPAWRRRGLVALFAYLVGFLFLTHRIWDVEHLIAGLLGVGCGWVAVREHGWRLPRRLVSLARFRARPWLAGLVVLAGLMNVLSAVGTRAAARVGSWNEDVPFAVLHGTRTFVALSGLFLILLGQGLSRGRRAAWLATALLLGGGAVANLVKGLDLEEALIELGLLLVLLRHRSDFEARPDVPSVARALRLSALALAILPLYAALGFALLYGEFEHAVTVGDASRETLARMALTTSGRLDGTTFEARWFLDSISFAWAGCLLVCAVSLLRPVLRPSPEVDRDRALRLLHMHGATTIAHMTSWPGNTLLLNRERDAYVAYRLIGDVALALGDPIGTDDGCRRAIGEFLRLARRSGWLPCIYGATPRFLDEYHQLGLATLRVGEDAFLDLPDLEFRGRHWQDVRTALNRAKREGVSFQMLRLDAVSPDVMCQLREISDTWLHTKGIPELGFTLGRLSNQPDSATRVAIARDQAGRVLGVVTWLPVHRAGGWVIDVMRRRPDAFPGVVEFLIARSALEFKAEGAPFAGLAVAPLARVAREEDDACVAERVVGSLAGLLEPFYHVRSLYEFKRKFAPRWEPVYIAYPGATSLPKTGYAILRAYLPNVGVGELRALLARAVLVARDGRGTTASPDMSAERRVT